MTIPQELNRSQIAVGFNINGKIHPILSSQEDFDLLQTMIATTMQHIDISYSKQYELKLTKIEEK